MIRAAVSQSGKLPGRPSRFTLVKVNALKSSWKEAGASEPAVPGFNPGGSWTRKKLGKSKNEQVRTVLKNCSVLLLHKVLHSSCPFLLDLKADYPWITVVPNLQVQDPSGGRGWCGSQKVGPRFLNVHFPLLSGKRKKRVTF